MNRMEKRRYRKKSRGKVFFTVVVCTIIFFCGLKVVDMGTGDMVGDSRQEVLFGFSNAGQNILQVNVLGEKVYINKEKIINLIRTFQDKLGQLKMEVMSGN